jgi:superfamily II DNA or RNA helicase
MIEPYNYQKILIADIIEAFKMDDTHLAQLGTSGGKTVVFSFLIKWYLSWSKQNVLVLAHLEELIGQAEAELSGIGIGSEPYDGKRKLKHHSRVYLAMIETTYRRVQKNKYFFPNIGLVICDEAHILIFSKVFSYFSGAKILGCTATPIVTKRETFYKCKYCRASYSVPTECCNETEADEWTRPYSLSKIYKNISVGPQPEELIEFGSIVQEISFKRHYTDDSTLKTDSDGEFVAETVEREYGTTNAAFNVVLNYEELCLGKKTLIFNSSTKTNLVVYEKFIAAGYTNVRMFDSVNKEQSGDRKELLQWFEETPDAILINAKIFTTGFNSRQVEAIIVNRPVGVLSLWLQICGRGCRSSLKIYKPNYILVDGGGNIDRFGEPSVSRDWYSIFHGKGAERAKSVNAEDVHSCPECGYLYPKQVALCPGCGFEIRPAAPRVEMEGTDVLQPIRPIPPPNAELIYIYTVRCEEDINFAFRIMVSQIVDLFRYYRVTAEAYAASLETGEFDKKTIDQIRKCYFPLLAKQDIQTPGRRTLAELLSRTKKQLDKYYENRRVKNSTGSSNLVSEQLLS